MAVPADMVLAAEKVISSEQAYRLSANGTLILLDIRSPREWAQSGIPEGSLAITLHQPNGKPAFLEAVRNAVKGNHAQPIALICAVGGRSHWAQRFLTENGFTDVRDVSEGVMGRGADRPGWIGRGLPIQPCQRCGS